MGRIRKIGTEQITMKIPTVLKEAVDSFASEMGMDRSACISMILKFYFDGQSVVKNSDKIMDALKTVINEQLEKND